MNATRFNWRKYRSGEQPSITTLTSEHSTEIHESLIKRKECITF